MNTLSFLKIYQIIYCALLLPCLAELGKKKIFFFLNNHLQCSNLGTNNFVSRQVLEKGKFPYTPFLHIANSLQIDNQAVRNTKQDVA